MKTFKEFLNENDELIKSKNFVLPQRAQSLKIVHVNTEPFDKGFKKDVGFYIGKNGTENSIGNRYNGFKEFLAHPDNKDIEVSEVAVHKDGRVSFGNGRHRYAVMRDMGQKTIPVAMDKESLMHAKTHGYV
ncbi:MAG: hypothetical protein PHG08_00755 [Bacilli bacterium]|nr:hypothetical protein [Bacilli bacterium]